MSVASSRREPAELVTRRRREALSQEEHGALTCGRVPPEEVLPRLRPEDVEECRSVERRTRLAVARQEDEPTATLQNAEGTTRQRDALREAARREHPGGLAESADEDLGALTIGRVAECAIEMRQLGAREQNAGETLGLATLDESYAERALARLDLFLGQAPRAQLGQRTPRCERRESQSVSRHAEREDGSIGAFDEAVLLSVAPEEVVAEGQEERDRS